MKKQVLLVIETSRAYGRGIIEGVSRFIRETESWSIQFEEQGVLTTVPDWLKTWRGDGIICRTGISPLGHYLRKLNLPLVELLGDGKQYVSEVQSDASAAGEMAAEHFLERGLQYFAYYSYGNAWWGKFRGTAFVEALQKRGRECITLLSMHNAKPEAFPQWKSLYEEPLQQWLTELPKPVGIWCAADTIAHRVHGAALQLGFRIPDEIAILGIDNDKHLCNIMTPSLSSIDPNSVVVGYHAAKLLDKKMEQKHDRQDRSPTIERQLIPPIGVITRQSTDIVATDDPEMVRVGQLVRTRALSKLNVDVIAEEFDISRRTLERRYRKTFGRSIDKEIFQLRMDQAKKLLRETLLSVSEIGEMVGFDGNYFIKAFRRHTGQSPRAYRNNHYVSGRPVITSDDEENQAGEMANPQNW